MTAEAEVGSTGSLGSNAQSGVTSRTGLLGRVSSVGEASSTSRKKNHLPALDGVRGLAILMVLAFHLLASNDRSSFQPLQLALDVRDQLWMGVTLFFSLSGFLITGILYDTLDTENYLRTFFARRVLRIFPVYYGFLALLLLLTPVLHLNWHGQLYRLWTYSVNIPFTPEWIANPAPYINLRHFWSLAVEEQFYLLWPFLLFFLRDWRKIFAATLIGSAVALALRVTLVLLGMGPANHALPFCMDALLLGGALALLVRSPYEQQVLRASPAVLSIAAAVILGMALHEPGMTWQSSVFLTTIGMTIIALGTTALVGSALLPGSIWQRIFDTRILRFFGTYSYGLYVYHYSIDAALTGPLRHLLEQRGVGKGAAILLAALPVVLLSILAAYLSYNLYEVHFLRLKRYFPYRMRQVKALS